MEDIEFNIASKLEKIEDAESAIQKVFLTGKLIEFLEAANDSTNYPEKTEDFQQLINEQQQFVDEAIQLLEPKSLASTKTKEAIQIKVEKCNVPISQYVGNEEVLQDLKFIFYGNCLLLTLLSLRLS